MSKLNDVQLKSIAPPSISHDENIQALCDTIDIKLREIIEATRLVLLLPRLDELPEEIVDELAWQYHVDFYNNRLPLDRKHTLVRQAIDDHRIKGTPAAVERVVTAAFQSGKVIEWFEYGGEPYHFKVTLIKEPLTDIRTIDGLVDAIYQVKNTRSWLDGVSFYREIFGGIYFGSCVSQHKTINIYPARLKQPDITANYYIGIAQQYHRKVEITKWQTGKD